MPSLRDSGKLVKSTVRQVALKCGMGFPLSLRRFIAAPGCPVSRSIHLHIKVLTDPAGSTIEAMLSSMRQVYLAAGIRVEVVSWETLTAESLGSATFNDLNVLDTGDCKGDTTAEQNQLFMIQKDVPADHRQDEIVVYFVQSVLVDGKTFNGCANHPAAQPGAAVATVASLWTLAHEVGHVLGLGHIAGEHKDCPAADAECCSTPDNTRLMTGCSTDNITGTPTFAQDEIDLITGSNLTHLS